MATTALTPLAAHAADSTTLYVNSASTACDDSGTGTAAVPFCNIQPAFDVVGPGDVVNIARGTYKPTTLSRSGTADAPIVVKGPSNPDLNNYASTLLTLAGASNVEIEGLGMDLDTPSGIVVDGGSNILITHALFYASPGLMDPVAVHVTDGASAVTLLDDRFDGTVSIDGQSAGTIVTTNNFNNVRGVPVAINNATATAITSNDIANCGPGINVVSSAGTRIENNIVTTEIAPDCPPDAQQPYGIAVDAYSTTSTVVDYNIVYASSGTPYLWGTAAKASAAALYSATGQGLHDNNSQINISLQEGSPAIDSADSAAVGEQATDIFGNPHVLDPTVAQTGAGPHNDYDRGAYEFADPYTATPGSSMHVNQTTVPVGTGIALTANLADTWGDTFSSYQYTAFDNADGTTMTPVISNSPSATISFSTPGKYDIYPLVESTGSQTYYFLSGVYTSVNAAAQQPFIVRPTTFTSGTRTVRVGDASTDDWNLTSYSFNFGDGKPPVSGQYTHTYTDSGTYTITETVTDSDGHTATGTIKYTTAGSDYHAYGPTRLLDTRSGLGAVRAKVSVGHSIAFKVAGTRSIPTGVTAVGLNVTVTDTVGNGYISVEPDGTAAKTANVYYQAGQTQTNYVIVPVAPDGKIDLYASGTAGGSVDLIGDVSGYFTHTPGSGYNSVTPKRILDTRAGTGAPSAKVRANSGLPVTIGGVDSIPRGASAVVVHVTVLDTTGNGWIGAEPDGAGTPGTSMLNYLKGQTVANNVIVPIGSDGKIELYNGGGTTSVDLLADVTGYFNPGAKNAYIPLTPYRAWDSRSQSSILLPNHMTWYPLGPASGKSLPEYATLITNITVTNLDANGNVTTYASEASRPALPTFSYVRGQTVTDLDLMATAGYRQDVSVYNQSSGSGDLIADVFGYFSN